MRIRPVILILMMTCSFTILVSTIIGGVSGHVLLVNDTTQMGNGSDHNYYEFVVLSENPVMIGVRPLSGIGFDIGTYEDKSFEYLLHESKSAEGEVNFVVLDGDSWTNPSELYAQVSSNPGDYIIEMENEPDWYKVGLSWVGTMDRPRGGPVHNIGSPGDLDDEGVYSPTMVFEDKIYHMWYTVFDGSRERIAYATSTDGLTWSKVSNQVVDSTGSQFDTKGVRDPYVLYDGNEFHMWYTGDGGTTTSILYATSEDGITWSISNAPALKANTIDSQGVSQPSVLHIDSYYHMWYASFDGSTYQIEYTTSIFPDKWPNPRISVLAPAMDPDYGDGWDNYNVLEPTVIYDGLVFHMWYAGNYGYNNRIGYATSYNGIDWTRYRQNPVLDVGPFGCWDDDHLTGHAVIQEGSNIRMWYSGHHGNNIRIGYATSNDMSSWTKYESPPEVLETYVVTDVIEGLTYTIDLDVPSTMDLDMFIFHKTGGRDDALASSANRGAGISESITFSPPFSGNYIIVITNENGGTGMYTVLTKSPPVPNILGDLVVDDDGKISFDAEAGYPGLIENSWQEPSGPVDISAGGSYMAVGWGSCISLFSTKSKIPLWIADINERVWELKLSDNGDSLVVLGDRTVYFFHTSSSAPLWSVDTGFSASFQPGNRLDMTGDGRYIAFKVWGDRILVLDTESKPSTEPYWDYDFGDEVMTVKLSGDGRYMVMGADRSHQMRLAWIQERSINWTHTSNDPIYSASLSFDGSNISCGQGGQHNVGLFHYTSSTPIWTYEIEGRQFEQVMSHDGRYLVSSNQEDNTPGTWNGFALWDTANSNPIWEYRISENRYEWADAVDMDTNAKYAVGGCRQGKVYLFSQFKDGSEGWSSGDGEPIYIYPTGSEIWFNGVSISADGTFFAAASSAGTYYLFSTTGKTHLVWSWNPSSALPVSGNYSWDFDASVDENGDGDFTNDEGYIGPNPTYVYDESGNYNVTLTLTTEDGDVHIYTMFVTVNIQEEPDSLVENVLKSGPPLAVIGIIAALLSFLFVGSTEVGKFRLIPFIFPLYSRLRKDEILEQETRNLIYQYIISNPGDNFNHIRNELDLNNGTLIYHLQTLEKEKYIKSMRDGIYKRFYPVNVKVQRVNGFGVQSVQGRMILHMMCNPGLTQKEISSAMKVSQQVVSYHLKLMAETGHVRTKKQGKTNRYYVNEWVPRSNM
jgi:predicted GH43/DUF377 family glycosyl hydrolase/DNA-binding MarR family transcriptional regulator